MRVLWLCNIMIPAIARVLGLEASNREGWLTGTYDRLMQENPEQNGITQLGIMYPVASKKDELCTTINDTDGQMKVQAYGYYEDLTHPEKYDAYLEERFREIVQEFQPDLVHIFGTEFPHCLAMTRAYGRPEKILIGLQGMMDACAKAYMADIPTEVIERVTFRDLVRKDTIVNQQQKFFDRSQFEKEALKNVCNVTGRTEFDQAQSQMINPNLSYFFLNETLRSNFYEGTWNLSKCEKYSIFLSQGDYPLKGFHYVLQAAGMLTMKYPNLKIYVAGNSVVSYKSIKDKLKISSYGKYLRELIRANHLEDKVEILGRLNADQMKERYLKSHVFICPSSLENSPNSLGEAMLLGVPCIASRVGGIPDMLLDEEEGYLFDRGDIKELAGCIERVFDNDSRTCSMAIKASVHAHETHDASHNYKRLIRIYQEISQK